MAKWPLLSSLLVLAVALLAEHGGSECRRCRGLHGGHDVLVGVHGHGDAGVSEAFADDLGVHVLLEEDGGVRVAEVVESDPGNLDPRDETSEGGH